MLPGMNGMDLCRRLRKESQTRRIPIIMLTAKASEADRVAGLDVGADDYIAKPFSVRELLARVRAVMRRTEDEGGERYDDGRLAIDFDDVRASCEGTNVKLTNKEFLLLSTLAKKKGRVITRQQLLDQVWGYSYYGDARTLDVHIRRLRQKLDACGDCIVATGPLLAAAMSAERGAGVVAAVARVDAVTSADRAGCVRWDSKYGANYNFVLR